MNNLKTIRKNKGLTLEKVADDLGMHPSTISKYENELHDIPIQTLLKFADYYDVQLMDIIGSMQQQLKEVLDIPKDLDEMETKMLEKFRKLDFDGKITILAKINEMLGGK